MELFEEDPTDASVLDEDISQPVQFVDKEFINLCINLRKKSFGTIISI